MKTLDSASDASLTNTGSLQPPLSPPAPPSAAHISHKRIFGSGLLPFLGQSNVSFFLTLLGEGSPSLTTLKFRCRFDLVSHPVDQLFTSVSIPVLQMQPLYKAFQEFSLQFSTNKEANGHSHWKSSVGIHYWYMVRNYPGWLSCENINLSPEMLHFPCFTEKKFEWANKIEMNANKPPLSKD